MNDYLFVDGGYFETTVKWFEMSYYDEKRRIPIAHHFLRRERNATSSYDKVFYYDSLPALNDGESEADYKLRIDERVSFYDRINLLEGFHVYYGTTRKKQRGKFTVNEQKQVDVLICVDMLTHAYQKNMSRATILTGDIDFKPLIDALVGLGVYVTLWYHPRSTSKELIHAADGKKIITYDTLYEMVSDTTGLLPRPEQEARIEKRCMPVVEDSEKVIKRWTSTTTHCNSPVPIYISEINGEFRLIITVKDAYVVYQGKDDKFLLAWAAEHWGISV